MSVKYKDMSQDQQKIVGVLAQVADMTVEQIEHDPCVAFYTPEEWKERKEEFGTDAVLVITHEGGNELYYYLTIDGRAYDKFERQREALEQIGFYLEQGTTWFSAVYKMDNEPPITLDSKEAPHSVGSRPWGDKVGPIHTEVV